jgi:hypothetical protein
MKIRMLKDWGWNKAGEVVEVFDTLAQDWILNGVAEEAVESRAVEVEQATAVPGSVEHAVVGEKRRMPKRS